MTKRPVFVSTVIFVVVLAVGGGIIKAVETRHGNKQRRMVGEIGVIQASALERQLERSLSATLALASILRQYGEIKNFDALAAEMIKNYGGINNLQLAPNGVVTQIYPLAGNEEAFGHDLLNDPRRRTEALQAIESRTLTLAGPFNLIQGGMGVVGRLPVFVPDEVGGERFWGFTIVLIRLPGLLEVSQVDRLVEGGYAYELSRTDPDTGERVVFARSAKAGLQNPVPFEIKVPNGQWTLAITPRGGWAHSSALPLEVVLVVLLGTVGAVLTYFLVRQPAILGREVELRTRELSEANIDLGSQITKRVRAEEALREKGERLQRLLETTNVIPWEADAKTWQFTYVGPQAVKLFGYPIEQWYEKDFWTTHIYPDDRDYAIDFCLTSSRNQDGFEFEYRMPRSSGEAIWVHDVVSVIRENGEPTKLRGFFIDVTERKHAEETFRALVEASASLTGADLFRALVSNLGAALGVRYAFVGEFVEGNTKARTHVFWSRDGFVDNLEYPLADTPCKKVLDGEMQYYPQDVQALFPKDKDLVTLEAEGYLAVPLTDESGNVLGHLAAIDDKPMRVKMREVALVKSFAARAGAELAREQADQALRKQRAFLRQVIDVDPNFIFAKDRDGRFTLVNQAVADAYGTTVEDLIGKTDADFNPNVEEVELFRQMDLEVMETLQERFIPEEAITDAQGKLRWLQTVKRPMMGEDGSAEQVLGSATDITERKRAEEALRAREAELRRNQQDLQELAGKLLTAQEAERRRLAREMHDDLTQRLAVLAIDAGKLETQLKSSRGAVPDKLREMKEHMVKLAADVHAISRQLHPSILDDLGLVDAMESECTSFSQREGILVTYEPENVPETLPKELGLCLYRITQEALRNISKHAQAREARVSLFGKDGVIILRIEDFGVGFDAVQMAGKKGLGLASMGERARLIQAELSVHAEPGRGTVIEVRAPLRGRT